MASLSPCLLPFSNRGSTPTSNGRGPRAPDPSSPAAGGAVASRSPCLLPFSTSPTVDPRRRPHNAEGPHCPHAQIHHHASADKGIVTSVLEIKMPTETARLFCACVSSIMCMPHVCSDVPLKTWMGNLMKVFKG